MFVMKFLMKHKISKENQAALRKLKTEANKKKLTDAGKNRKQKIAAKLFHQKKKTDFIMGVYSSVLPMLKKYVIVFQAKEPRLDSLHDEQLKLLLDFLRCFVRPEKLSGCTSKSITNIDLSCADNHLPQKDIFLGRKAQQMLEKHPRSKNLAETVLIVKKAYIMCAQSLQRKIPLNDTFLQCVSALNPVVRQHTPALQCL